MLQSWHFQIEEVQTGSKGEEVRDYEDAADEFLDSLWATQVGQRAMEVTYMIRFGEYYV